MYTGKNDNIGIVPLGSQDLPQAIELIVKVAREDMGFPEEAVRHFRASINTPPHTIIGAKIHDEVVGVIVCLPPEGGVMTVQWLVVSRGFRGQGVGTRLFDEACRLAIRSGCHKIKLTVTTPESVDFYRHRGMTIEGVFKDHWWHLDFWAMGKVLR